MYTPIRTRLAAALAAGSVGAIIVLIIETAPMIRF